MPSMRERLTTEDTIERYLRARVHALGGRCIKLDPTMYPGIQDRLVLLPGRVVFVAELKRPVGGRYERGQLAWARRMRMLGVPSYTPRTKKEVDDMLTTESLL